MAETGKPAPSKAEGGQAKDAAMRVDTALVRELADMLTDHELTEIEVSDGDRTIRVVRDHVRDLLTSSPSYNQLPASAPAQVTQASPPAEELAGETVKSPMVGTAFLSAEPDAKPFITVGDTVKAGDTLLIIEAMKVMNPIVAPNGGVVRKIMVADAQPVEFDQPLVIVG